MSKIEIGTVNGKAIGFDVDLLVRSRLLIQADSGGGKSWVIRRLAEQAFRKVQEILIDPEGEFSTLREKFDFVLVGKGGETPADPRSAGLVARRLLELRASAVCDLYELKFHQRHEWVKNFLEGMIEAPKNLWRPVLVIVDEAHAFCPERGKGESIASGPMIDLATKGRKRGFCAVWATQSLGKLNKDASGMLQNRLIGPTFEDINRKRAGETLSVEPGKPMREFFREIKLLEPGNFFALGRAISLDRVMVHVGPVLTTHPEPGSSKHAAAAPPAPDKIKALLPKLADLPKEADDKARTEAELRQEIRSLKAQISSKPAAEKIVQRPDPRDTKRAIAAAVKPLEAFRHLSVSLATKIAKQLAQVSLQYSKSIEDQLRDLERIQDAAKNIGTVEFSPVAPADPRGGLPRTPPVRLPSVLSSPAKALPPSPVPPAGSNGDAARRSFSEEIAGALAAYHPDAVSSDLLAVMCGRTPGGSWSARLSELRGAGLLADVGKGQVIATEECAAQFRGRAKLPQSTAEVLEIWNPKLSEVHRQILEVLIAQNGEAVRVEELAQAVGKVAGGSFSARLSELRSKLLIVDPARGQVAANKTFLLLES